MLYHQKLICRELFKLSYESGFHSYPLSMVAEKIGLPLEQVLGEAEFMGPDGQGLLDVSPDGKSAGINFDMREFLEDWTR